MLPAESDHEMNVLLALSPLHQIVVNLTGSVTDHHSKVESMDQ